MTESNPDHRAVFITYEGIEGAGKSTQIKAVADHFLKQSKRVLVTREPGGTETAEKIRNILLHPGAETLHAKAELYLMQAARVQHIEHVIKPNLSKVDLILCDRFVDSSTAYQGAGRDLSIEQIEALNAFSTGSTMPLRTFWIDIPVSLSVARTQNRKKADRFEQEQTAFFEHVRQGYQHICDQNPDRVIKLDGTLPKNTLIATQISMIQELMNHHA